MKLTVTSHADSQSVSLYDHVYNNVTSPPAGLSVCSESRKQYHKVYEFLATTPYCPSPRGDGALIYFAHDRDVLEVPGRSFVAYDPGEVLAIRSVQPVEWTSSPLHHCHGISRWRVNIYNYSVGEIIIFMINFSWLARDVESLSLYIERNGNRRGSFNGVPAPSFDEENMPNPKFWESTLPRLNKLLEHMITKIRAEGDDAPPLPEWKTAREWKTVAYTRTGEMTPKPDNPFEEHTPNPSPEASIATTALATVSAGAPSASNNGPEPARSKARPQELLALVPAEGISPPDLMKRLNKTHFVNKPFLCSLECMDCNNAWKHLVLGEGNLLKPIGNITLILEWA